MREIGGLCRHRDFTVARQLDLVRFAASVGERHASDFSGVGGDDGDFRARLDVAVHAMQRHAIRRQPRATDRRGLAERLIRRRPHRTCRKVVDVTELAGDVAGAVGAPARHRNRLISTVTAAIVVQHHRVRQRTEERDTRRRWQTGHDFANHRAIGLLRRADLFGLLNLSVLQHEAARDAFVQKQLDRFHQRISVEALLPPVVQQHVCQRHQTHADVVRHVCADERHAGAWRGTRVVQCIAEAVVTERTHCFQRAQIGQRARRIDLCGERGGVRRNDQIAAESTLEGKIGNAECAVLIRLMTIADVVRALAHAPRNIARSRIRHVPLHHAVVRLRQQCEWQRPHHKHRHQVLEHAAAPAHQRR